MIESICIYCCANRSYKCSILQMFSLGKREHFVIHNFFWDQTEAVIVCKGDGLWRWWELSVTVGIVADLIVRDDGWTLRRQTLWRRQTRMKRHISVVWSEKKFQCSRWKWSGARRSSNAVVENSSRGFSKQTPMPVGSGASRVDLKWIGGTSTLINMDGTFNGDALVWQP